MKKKILLPIVALIMLGVTVLAVACAPAKIYDFLAKARQTGNVTVTVDYEIANRSERLVWKYQEGRRYHESGSVIVVNTDNGDGTYTTYQYHKSSQEWRKRELSKVEYDNVKGSMKDTYEPQGENSSIYQGLDMVEKILLLAETEYEEAFEYEERDHGKTGIAGWFTPNLKLHVLKSDYYDEVFGNVTVSRVAEIEKKNNKLILHLQYGDNHKMTVTVTNPGNTSIKVSSKMKKAPADWSGIEV